MKKDTAAFRLADLQAIWGPSPLCVFTLGNQIEFHHILGRGGNHGIGREHPDRKLFSSVFNAVPISPAIHKGPLRDAPEVRRLFLWLVRTNVLNEAADGGYFVTELDQRFLDEIAVPWLLSHP